MSCSSFSFAIRFFKYPVSTRRYSGINLRKHREILRLLQSYK